MFRTLDQLDPRGKRVVLRADLNVPAKDGKVTDTTRIDRSAATIRELAGKGGKVIILTHFGRPKGREEKYSQKLLLEPLAKAVGRSVAWADDVIGIDAVEAVKAMKDGDILLMENVRFHPEEEKNDATFARALADLGDVYVNDAFSTAHRAHASTEAIARLIPAYAGRLMQAELEALGKALESPEKPVAAVVGGAKVSTKLDLLGNLVAKVDYLIIGGGMANTFLFAQGVQVGKSLCEKELADTAREIIEKAKAAHCHIVLPVDVVVATEFAENAPNQVVPVNAVPEGRMILDAGPA
ncbi:MAG TPA: phosphoglycerate kinase, partial [Candidatus Sulfotelmatobacter sp.]|nr:phosphoglycerate kinase [Candidatus Sulfotelmatobacter sp.]